MKIYWKSSSCSTVSGEDLFWGNRFPRESWGFNAIEPFKEVIPDFTEELCEDFKWADNVPLVVFALEERDSSGFLCQDISMDFWFRFFFDLKRFSFPTSPCIFGLTFDSIGTSFPSTWFVKTKVTWNNISFDLAFSKGNHYNIYTRTHTQIYISSLPLMDNGHDICFLFHKIFVIFTRMPNAAKSILMWSFVSMKYLMTITKSEFLSLSEKEKRGGSYYHNRQGKLYCWKC